MAIQLNNEVYLLDKASGAEQAHLQYSSNVFIPSWVAIDSQSFYWNEPGTVLSGLVRLGDVALRRQSWSLPIVPTESRGCRR